MMVRLGVLILSGLLLFCVFGLENEGHAAEPYPVKPINFIVPNEAGSGADFLARPLVQRVSTMLGKPIVVVNKPGAGSSIGFREVYGAKPDGYTLGMGHPTIIINKLAGILPYDHNAFTVLGTYATFIPIIVASAKTQRPFKTLEEALSFSKSHPGEVSIATSNVGGSMWIATLVFEGGTGQKFNIIPQAGTGAFAIAQVAGGHADLAVVDFAASKSQIEAGNVRFIAVFGSRKAPGYEGVPTMKELGYKVNWESTQILIGPPKMPREIVDRLVKAFEGSANDPEFKKFVIERNAVPFYLPPEKAVQYFDELKTIVRPIMDKAGILKEK